jgi:hypothetical protein
VIVDLKGEELMDRSHCDGIGTDDVDLASICGWFEKIFYFLVLGLHDRNAWRHGVMDEHWYLEIAAVKHLDDVRQVRPDFVASRRIACFVGNNFGDHRRKLANRK